MDIFTRVPTNYGGLVERFRTQWEEQVQTLKARFGEAIEQVLMPDTHPVENPVIFVSFDRWIEVLRFAKTDPALGYSFLSDYTVSDETPEEPRFHLIVQLFNLETKSRIRFKCKVNEGQSAETLIPVWEGANWAEREIYDMFGISFNGHPDLRRIVLDVRWQGHPLRKDYPLKGYQLFQTPEPIDTKLLEG